MAQNDATTTECGCFYFKSLRTEPTDTAKTKFAYIIERLHGVEVLRGPRQARIPTPEEGNAYGIGCMTVHSNIQILTKGVCPIVSGAVTAYFSGKVQRTVIYFACLADPAFHFLFQISERSYNTKL